METVSSEGLLEFHSSDELTGGFLTTWGELESEGQNKIIKAGNENNANKYNHTAVRTRCARVLDRALLP